MQDHYISLIFPGDWQLKADEVESGREGGEKEKKNGQKEEKKDRDWKKGYGGHLAFQNAAKSISIQDIIRLKIPSNFKSSSNRGVKVKFLYTVVVSKP